MNKNTNVIEVSHLDDAGNVGAIFYLQRSQIAFMVYSPIDDVLTVNVAGLTQGSITSSPEEVFDDKGNDTGENVFVSRGQWLPVSLRFKDHRTILELINFYYGTTYTAKNYEGFKIRKEFLKQVEEALEKRKQMDEEAEKKKREDLIANPHVDANKQGNLIVPGV